MKGTIIKCKDCGFKYYDGDIHNCVPVRVVSVEEKTEARKVPVKTRKESFKMWGKS
jgi:hypothetical protein